MYITCKHCKTSFMVSPDKIGITGRKVKCSKCHHVWYQELDSIHLKNITLKTNKPSIINTSKRNISFEKKSGINLPALLPIKIPRYLYAMPIFLMFIIITLSLILFNNEWSFYSIEQNKLITVDDVNYINNELNNTITVSYNITNNSDMRLMMPMVRLRLFDKKDKQYKMHIDDHSKVVLSPGQYVRIRTEFKNIKEKPYKMDITLGNSLDFMLR